MDPLIRRRLPPSVRSLLTDIGPKEEWETDQEPGGAVPRDGILLPAREAASSQEEFLTPAKTTEDQATGDETPRRSAVCMLCKHKPACYTCPRCNLHYCGLACYQSQDHSVCSEEFYKESVLRELKDMGKTETEGRRKMQEILIGLNQKAQMAKGGMESVLREAGIIQDTEEGEDGGAEERVQVVELLSRLAEFQQAGEGSSSKIEAILRQLEELGSRQDSNEEPLAEDAGSVDLASRLAGLDIDKLSEEELWDLLDSKEKEKFVSLLKGGALAGLVPLWEPWWEEHEKVGGVLVEVLEQEVRRQEKAAQGVDNQTEISDEVVQDQATKVGKMKGKNKKDKRKDEGLTVSGVPVISAKIPKLSSLCTNPSPLICYSLVNALYCYTFTLCLLNGDTNSLLFEFCDMILALSEALNSGRVFNSIQEALDGGETFILGGGYFDKDDPEASARATEAVAHIMTGRDRKDATGYCLAALSHIRSALTRARAALPKEGQEGQKRQKYFLASKKCEFFQAWVLDNSHQTRTLAIQLWDEHSRRQSARTSMDKIKTVVEESVKKGKKKENIKLIQELR
ncbi:zinc finger HIT domain-containing protein 2 [Aulostomus maculatus]